MSALSTGMQGAQLGGKFGGAWGAAGGAILGFIAGGKAEKRANEATKKYNDQVVKYAAQDLFDLRRQQNVENIRTAQALASYQDSKKVQNSTITASMGAADIIGSSADALKQTLDYQTKQAQAETMLNWETGIENYNTGINQLENQRNQQFKRQNAAGQEDLGALVKGAADLYKNYGSGFAGMKEDVAFAWDNRSQLASLAKSVVKSESNSLVGQLSSFWAPSGATAKLNSDVQPMNTDTMKTFGAGAYGKGVR